MREWLVLPRYIRIMYRSSNDPDGVQNVMNTEDSIQCESRKSGVCEVQGKSNFGRFLRIEQVGRYDGDGVPHLCHFNRGFKVRKL